MSASIAGTEVVTGASAGVAAGRAVGGVSASITGTEVVTGASAGVAAGRAVGGVSASITGTEVVTGASAGVAAGGAVGGVTASSVGEGTGAANVPAPGGAVAEDGTESESAPDELTPAEALVPARAPVGSWLVGTRSTGEPPEYGGWSACDGNRPPMCGSPIRGADGMGKKTYVNASRKVTTQPPTPATDSKLGLTRRPNPPTLWAFRTRMTL